MKKRRRKVLMATIAADTTAITAKAKQTARRLLSREHRKAIASHSASSTQPLPSLSPSYFPSLSPSSSPSTQSKKASISTPLSTPSYSCFSQQLILGLSQQLLRFIGGLRFLKMQTKSLPKRFNATSSNIDASDDPRTSNIETTKTTTTTTKTTTTTTTATTTNTTTAAATKTTTTTTLIMRIWCWWWLWFRSCCRSSPRAVDFVDDNIYQQQQQLHALNYYHRSGYVAADNNNNNNNNNNSDKRHVPRHLSKRHGMSRVEFFRNIDCFRLPLLLFIVLQYYCSPTILAQSSSSSSSIPSLHYIEYNLADYCSEKNWNDYPGRHRIRLEKAVHLRRPTIVDFHYNDTHRQIASGGQQAFLPIDHDEDSSGTRLVPYCLLTFYADYGYRIYAEGFATGVEKGGRDWFTETLHLKAATAESDRSSMMMMIHDPILGASSRFGRQSHQMHLPSHAAHHHAKSHHNRRASSGSSSSSSSSSWSSSSSSGMRGTGPIEITTQKETFSLVFEQLHLRRFTFHLVITPFREAPIDYTQFDGIGEGGCDREREYSCANSRCIAQYLACDHHNNCGDHSDEAANCLSKISTTTTTATPPKTSTDRQSPYGGEWPPQPPGPRPDYFPDTTSELPTYDIDGNRIEPPRRPAGSEDLPPEYIDVPLPPDYTGRYRPITTTSSTRRPPLFYDTINGFGGTSIAGGAGAGGFLEDLFTFSSAADGRKISNVVYVVRYLLAVLVIIILVTLVNFLIWCLITKRDQSFMAPAPASPTPTQRAAATASPSTLSVISDV